MTLGIPGLLDGVNVVLIAAVVAALAVTTQ
jgi:hypothetical protein